MQIQVQAQVQVQVQVQAQVQGIKGLQEQGLQLEKVENLQTCCSHTGEPLNLPSIR